MIWVLCVCLSGWRPMRLSLLVSRCGSVMAVFLSGVRDHLTAAEYIIHHHTYTSCNIPITSKTFVTPYAWFAHSVFLGGGGVVSFPLPTLNLLTLTPFPACGLPQIDMTRVSSHASQTLGPTKPKPWRPATNRRKKVGDCLMVSTLGLGSRFNDPDGFPHTATRTRLYCKQPSPLLSTARALRPR